MTPKAKTYTNKKCKQRAMIYICEDTQKFDSVWLQAAMKQLPEGRRERALRYRQPTDRMLSAAAYLLLRYAAQRECGFRLEEDLTRTVGGKPFLPNHPEMHFSISHCREAVAVAIDDAPIGIDVETIRPYEQDVAAYCCSAEELQTLEAVADKATAFTVIWTQKESLLKRNGDAAPHSIKEMLQGAADDCFHTLTTARYVCTACTTGDVAPQVMCVPGSELLSRDVEAHG